LEIIGEAANHLSHGVTQNFTQIPWAQVVGMRNLLIHEYFGIDPELVWDIIKNDVPNLKDQISNIFSEIK
jgi:uncharacterized protein with HEPN domain